MIYSQKPNSKKVCSAFFVCGVIMNDRHEWMNFGIVEKLLESTIYSVGMKSNPKKIPKNPQCLKYSCKYKVQSFIYSCLLRKASLVLVSCYQWGSFIIFFIPMELAVISTTNGLTKINKYERFVFYLLKSALEGWMYTDWLSTCVL